MNGLGFDGQVGVITGAGRGHVARFFTEPAGPGDEMAELYAAIMADPAR
jgi:hypothetical protein